MDKEQAYNQNENSDNGIEILEIDGTSAVLLNKELVEFEEITSAYIEDYMHLNPDTDVGNWLSSKMQKNIDDGPQEDVSSYSKEIIETLKCHEEEYDSIQKSASKGITNESWFANEILKVTSFESGQSAAQYLSGLDDAVTKANEALLDTITTKSGLINQNPSLDGFIAEEYHAQTFNMNATAKGSPYHAEVLKPNGHRYGANSVDIVIKDASGKIVKRYQCKYCKDSQKTAQAFKTGDYRGQRGLNPSDQDVARGETVIKSPDGTTSNPLPKANAKQMQKEAQSGNWNGLNWNEYQLRDLAIGIGKKSAESALLGLFISMTMSVIQQEKSGEEFSLKKTIADGIKGGASFGIKAAIAGAIKVASEKEIIHFIPKGTPAETIASIVHVAFEEFKVISELAKGELTIEEALNKSEKVILSTVAGICLAAKGSAVGARIGAIIGTALGPQGMVLGGIIGGILGFIGSTIGYVIGSEVTGKAVEKLQEKRKHLLSKISNAVQENINHKGEHPLVAKALIV